jgi:hypothetical protein
MGPVRVDAGDIRAVVHAVVHNDVTDEARAAAGRLLAELDPRRRGDHKCGEHQLTRCPVCGGAP